MIKACFILFLTLTLKSWQPQAKVRKVVILGNSIVQHGPNEKLGWSGNWGMAASSMENDFVHLLISAIHKKDNATEVLFKNIAAFERNYKNYDLQQLDSFTNADIIIMKIAENVIKSQVKDSGFIDYYNTLIKYLDPEGKALVVSCDGFWGDSILNPIIRENAAVQQYNFVQLSDLTVDSSNTAKGLFANKGVANHPSDKGMKAISDRIWERIRKEF